MAKYLFQALKTPCCQCYARLSWLLTACVTLKNIPHLHDVTTTVRLLRQMGVSVTLDDNMNIELDPSTINNFYAPYDLVKTMRSSILVLGPLLTKFGTAKVSLPGGCAIGTRPVEMHLDALSQMGASIV